MVGSTLNEEKGKKTLDSTVGGLVWVQRRNGTWWPGQIVGVDELPENGLSSPKSGTPIKLLGRDDLIVEWYDFETTKVIKAFRCGEYDACIEKAKVSAPKFLKRSLRYPRKEIAIFRALEIENDSLIKKGSKLGDDHECSSEKASSELASPSEASLNSAQELSHSGKSYEETNGSMCLRGRRYRGKRGRNPNDSEDDGNEGSRRMKGLNDLGVGSDRKIHVLGLASASHVGPPSSGSLNSTRPANGTIVGTLANGGAVPTIKKKRSQVVDINELLKRDYQQRPLTKVLEHTTMVPVQIICDESANPFERSDTISPSFEYEDHIKLKDNEPSSNCLPEVFFSDTEFDVPFIDEELDPSGFPHDTQPSSPLKPRVSMFKRNSGNNFHIQASYVKHEVFNEHGPVENGASKWQSKGKRNTRHVSKDADLAISPRSNGFLNYGFTGLSKHMYESVSFPRLSSFIQPQPCFNSSELSDVSSSYLYEVEVTVEATRPQVQYVPYISLVSKESGNAITGHPVAVEALEDGFCDLDYLPTRSCDVDDQDAKVSFVVEANKQCKIKRSKKFQSHNSRRKRKSFKSRKHGSSSKKTRKLSSLSGPDNLNPEKRISMVLSSNNSTLACVPLKIVFSRINEALSRSKQSAHSAVTTDII